MIRTIIRCRGVIIHDNKILVVKHLPDSKNYALPGGKLEINENPIETITRELIEELGVVPIVERLMYVNTYTDTQAEKHNIEFIFLIKNSIDYINCEDLERTHAHEIDLMEWVKISELHNLRPSKINLDLNLSHIPTEVCFIN